MLTDKRYPTISQLKAVLEFVGNQPFQVKSKPSHRSTPGRSRLIGISGSKVVIRPHHHHKNEIVETNEILWWPGGNNHIKGISEFMSSTEFVRLGESQKESVETSSNFQQFVIVNPKTRWIWSSGSWTNRPNNPSRYNSQADATRVIERNRIREDFRNATVIPLAQLSEWHSEMNKPKTVVVEAASGPAVKPSTVEAKATETRPAPSFEMDFVEKLASSPSSDLVAAFERRQRAAQDVIEARRMLADSEERFAQAIEEFNRLLNVKPVPVVSVTTKTTTATTDKQITKRGVLRDALQQVLKRGGSVSRDALIEQTRILSPLSSESSVKQAIIKMVANGEIVKRDDHYSLKTNQTL